MLYLKSADLYFWKRHTPIWRLLLFCVRCRMLHSKFANSCEHFAQVHGGCRSHYENLDLAYSPGHSELIRVKWVRTYDCVDTPSEYHHFLSFRLPLLAPFKRSAATFSIKLKNVKYIINNKTFIFVVRHLCVLHILNGFYIKVMKKY